jgi:putative ABC transport system permease protein
MALTLGIGAATTVFSVADRVLFRPLPYVDARRLVAVGADVRSLGLHNWAVSADEFDAWRERSRTLADLAGHFEPRTRSTLTLPDEPVELAVSRVTESFLGLVGVVPAIGRPFNTADFVPGAPQAVLLMDAAWRRFYLGDPAVVGRTVKLDDTPAVIAGVLPRTFVFPASSVRTTPDILVPFIRTPDSRLTMIGRLAPDATVETAGAEINALAAARGGESGLRNAAIDGATVEPLADLLATKPRTIMVLLVGAVATLLLIGCANVANLLLARGTDRQGELTVRRALGASRSSLVRLLLSEAAALAAAGGAAGALLAYWAIAAIGPLIPGDLLLLGPIAVDGRALLFTTSASVLCVLFSGLGPALSATRANMMPALSRSSTRATHDHLRVRQLIVGLEVALAVVLLVAGGLMVNTMMRLVQVDVGYRSDAVLTMRVRLPQGRTTPARSKPFVERTLEAARHVPGIASVGASEGVPLANTLYGSSYGVEGFSDEWMAQGASNGGGPCCTQTQWVSADYFVATGIQVLRGRAFTHTDAAVALIGERLARKFPEGVDPIGHYLTPGGDGSDRRVIIGVVRDVRDMAVERQALQTIYLPLEERGASALTLVMRTAVAPQSAATAVREAVQRSVGPVVITDVRTLDDVIAKSVAARRLNAWLFGTFGVLALLLTAVGIVSVVSYSVARRTREIGVRLALGASPSNVRRLIAGESIAPVLVALPAGIVVALGLSRLVASLLYEVTPRDGWTYAAVCLVLAGTAIAAAYVPARRAARVDPMAALRAE